MTETSMPRDSAAGAACEDFPEGSLESQAVALAEALLDAGAASETRSDRMHGRRMAGMLRDPEGKAFTIALADEVLRFSKAGRGARRFRQLLQRHGAPGYLGAMDRGLLRLGAQVSRFLPGLVMPLVAAQVRRQSRNVILAAEDAPLQRYLKRRKASGMRVNINLLGEAVLGEGEAERRLDAILVRLADPRIDHVSVKLSAIFSQIHLVDYAGTLAKVCERLRRVYRAAIAHGRGRPKFVNLDMEEYRDLHLTAEAFCTVLEEQEFAALEAGIVLQAYLPDAFGMLRQLTGWARGRQGRGGAGIRVRLVKGANLAMERMEASLHGWTPAPYGSKLEADANFKRMLRYGCRPENAAVVRIGVASHNLFDIAYALLLREHHNVADRVGFEMLEGMANTQAAEVRQRAGEMLLYAPVVRAESFQNAIAYLVRRLEENAAPQNFLHDVFDLRAGSDAWNIQKERFLAACRRAADERLQATPRRRQNRLTAHALPDAAGSPFSNTPDTDFALPANREWIEAVYARAAGLEWPPERAATVEDVDRALAVAVGAQPAWEQRGVDGRAEILRNAAAVIANQRGTTLACMIREACKAAAEADTEISEAVDFADYYARSLDEPCWRDGVHQRALGVVLVAPPWNFPYAIPAGGCMAALMAGNCVILKPAPETVATARLVADHLWEAGVPRDVLQFLAAPDNDAGRALVTDQRVSAVILTGACATAQLFQSWKPELRLIAETSGKNCMVITQAADLDLAVRDLVRSAFGHAGQKCSAASLALVEAAVYDDPAFRRQLRDAAESLHVGLASDKASVVTPLIREPGADLWRALTQLDPGEQWLLQPRALAGSPCLWSPGIRLGVRRGSWFHRTECFGPVLGVMRVRDLEEAIEVQNDSAFGLAGGIHSLDEQEVLCWREHIAVGNAYINRAITGAIVQRQPFGGWKQSGFGPGAKAGGPNYVASLARWHDSRTIPVPSPNASLQAPQKDEEWQRWNHELQQIADDCTLDPEMRKGLEAALRSYAYWWRNYFWKEHDPSKLPGESNSFRYRCRRHVLVLAGTTGPARFSKARALLAAAVCGASTESFADAGAAVAALGTASAVRLLDPLVSPDFRLAANAAHVPILDGPVVSNGRIELLNYLREQSVSQTIHRHGSLFASPPRRLETTSGREQGAFHCHPPDPPHSLHLA